MSKEKFRESLVTKISKRKLQILEKEAEVGRKFIDVARGKQYKSTKLGRLLYGMAVVHTTKIGVNTLEKIIILATMVFFANIGYSQVKINSIAKLCPSSSTLKPLMVDLAVDCVSSTSKEMKKKLLSLMCDKGADNDTAASSVKLLSFYDDVRERVVVRCFGIEQTGNASKDTAMGIDHSLKLFDYSLPEKMKFSSSITDADGGGVGLSLVEEVHDVGCAQNNNNHTGGICTLHAMNLMFSAPVEIMMGVGGFKKGQCYRCFIPRIR